MWLAIAAGAIVLLLIAVSILRTTRAGPGEDRLDDDSIAGGTAAKAATPEQRCASRTTYDLMKRELFRLAVQTRGSDAASFDRLAAYAAIRVTSPVLKREDDELGLVACSGDVALDLPPGVAVVGGRRTLQAKIDYMLQPAADRSGDVITLDGADPIIVPLATLARTGGNAPLPQADTAALPPSTPATSQPVPMPAPPNGTVTAPPPPPPQPDRTTVQTRPSFDCARARTRGELAVCGNPGLAALDRDMAAAFFSARSQADSRQRALLDRTRSSFLAYRDRCGSDSCIAGAYRDRIREIRDIMSGNWRP